MGIEDNLLQSRNVNISTRRVKFFMSETRLDCENGEWVVELEHRVSHSIDDENTEEHRNNVSRKASFDRNCELDGVGANTVAFGGVTAGGMKAKEHAQG